MSYIQSKSRALIVAAFVALSVSVASADGGFNPRIYAGVFDQQAGDIGGLVGRTDANLNLYVIAVAPGAAGQSSNIGGLVGRTDASLNLYVTMASGSVISAPSFTGQVLVADGTALLPSIAYTSEATLGFWRSAAATITSTGNLNIGSTSGVLLTSGGDVTLGAGRFLRWNAKSALWPGTGDGQINIGNFATTVGSQFKADALPTVSACGAGSPAVIAGSTPLSGGVTVGTGGPATCTITFGGTAYPSAPHCSGAVETVTAASARAMGYSATATVLTIVPATAWADGSVVNWTCISSK
jgi:hypothetical protein